MGNRFRFWGVVTDRYGNVVPDANVSVYVQETGEPAKVYPSINASTPVATPPQIKTDSRGYFEFWIDDNDYPINTLFKIVIEKEGIERIIFENVRVLIPIEHNKLLNLQGGKPGEYYHLTSDQFNKLTQGLDASDLHHHDSRYYTKSEIDDKLSKQDEFIELKDTPNAYSGYAKKFVRVKQTEDGLEFSDVTWDDIVNKPETYPPSPHTHTWSEISDAPPKEDIMLRSQYDQNNNGIVDRAEAADRVGELTQNDLMVKILENNTETSVAPNRVRLNLDNNAIEVDVGGTGSYETVIGNGLGYVARSRMVDTVDGAEGGTIYGDVNIQGDLMLTAGAHRIGADYIDILENGSKTGWYIDHVPGTPSRVSIVSPSFGEVTQFFENGRVVHRESVRIDNRLGVNGYDPDSGYPYGWSGGIHVWDVYAEGSVGVGRNSKLFMWITSDPNNGGRAGFRDADEVDRIKIYVNNDDVRGRIEMIDKNGNVCAGMYGNGMALVGFDFKMARTVDGDYNWKRALVPYPTKLVINFAGDFVDGVRVEGKGMEIVGDIWFTDSSKGIILIDRATGQRYRLYIENGQLKLEPA